MVEAVVEKKGETQVTRETAMRVPLKMLVESDHNLRGERAKERDYRSIDGQTDIGHGGDVDRMASSLENLGQLANLIVYQEGDEYPVADGETRRLAFNVLVTRGVLTDEHLVDVTVRPKDEALKVSWAANNERFEMSVRDRFKSYMRFIKEKMTAEEISKVVNLPIKEVDKIIRVCGIHRKVLNALLKKPNFDIEAAASYAATQDRELQLSIFSELGPDAHSYSIQEMIRNARISSNDRRVIFVGVEKYKELGGEVTTDLLGDEYIVDGELLERLVQRKLEAAGARKSKGLGWYRVVDADDYYQTCRGYDSIEPDVDSTPEDLRKTIEAADQAWEKADQALDAYWDDDDEEDEGKEVELRKALTDAEKVRDRVYRQQQKHLSFSPELSEYVGVFLTLDRNGKVMCSDPLISSKDKKARLKEQDQSGGTEGGTDAVAVESHDRPATGKFPTDMFVRRRSVVRAAMVSAKPSDKRKVEILKDLAWFEVIRGVMTFGYMQCSLSLSVRRVQDRTSLGDAEESQARTVTNDVLKKLDLTWLELETVDEQFDGFSALSLPKKTELIMAAIGLMLGDDKQYGAGGQILPTTVMNVLNVDVKTLWRPTIENYFKDLKSGKLQELLVEWYGPEGDNAKATEKGTKKARLEAIARIFEGPENELTEAEQNLRQTWLPEEMSLL